MQQIVSRNRLSNLTGLFDAEAQTAKNNSLRLLQYDIQKAWFAEGKVAHVELITWSRGTVDPAPNASYVSIIGGVLVSSNISGVSMILIRFNIASNKPRKCSTLAYSYRNPRDDYASLSVQHISSNDPLLPPSLDAGFLENEFGQWTSHDVYQDIL